MANNGIVSGKDEGNCEFNTDLDRGKITVTVRAPLTIDKRSVEIGITDLLEIAAEITTQWIQYGRELHARMAAKKDA